MQSNVIGNNIRRIRKAKKISQQRMATDAKLSVKTCSGIETGKLKPFVNDLLQIARSLDVHFRLLKNPVREFKAVRFRSNKCQWGREQVLADVGIWLDDFEFLEEILGDSVEFKLGGVGRKIQKYRSRKPEFSAKLARSVLGLDAKKPVWDICGLLESGGIKVGMVDLDESDFLGLSIAEKNEGSAILVNTYKDFSMERCIFAAAHELGHLILHKPDYDVSHLEEHEQHEKQANDFATEFLMPSESFWEIWYGTRGHPLVIRVLKIKGIFGVSFRTVLYRLAMQGRYRFNLWEKFQVEYEEKFKRKLSGNYEPNALATSNFRASFPEPNAEFEPESHAKTGFIENRLHGLVRKALDSDKISMGRAAEILNISRIELRNLVDSWVNWKISEAN